MVYNNTEMGEIIRTGDLVTIDSMSENNEVYWHIANLTSNGNTIYYPYDAVFRGDKTSVQNLTY